MVTVLGVVALITVVPALSLLYREFLPAAPPRASILLTVWISATAAVTWVITSLAVPAIGAHAVQIPILVLAIVAGLLGSLPARRLTTRPLILIVYTIAWTALVFSPVSVIVLFPNVLDFDLLAAPIDLGGVLPVHITAGAAALASILLRSGATDSPPLARPTGRLLASSAVALWLGWACLLVALEFEINQSTARIIESAIVAPAAAIVGWLAVQRIVTGTTTITAATAGLVSGLVAVSAGSAFLDPYSAALTGLCAGVGCAAFVVRRVAVSGRAEWFPVGAHLLAGVIGLVALGIVGTARGFIFTGQLAVLQAGLWAAILTSVLAVVVTIVLLALTRAVVARGRRPVAQLGPR